MSNTALRQHFVTFYSPGTFVHEETTKPMIKWDIKVAQQGAQGIVERHGARPFAFQFSTRASKELESQIVNRSPLYYLGGKIETLAEVKARATDKDRILLANMEGNGLKQIITTNNPHPLCQPFGAGDVILAAL